MTALHDEGRRTVLQDEGHTANTLIFRPSSFVLAIILVYLVIGALYAVKTPAWQVPDEPAHYNYIRFIAEGRGLPILQPGDYDPTYLERIKAARFPSSMPIDSIRYEFWQPPLYYVLAAPIYLASGGSLLALRFFSVVLGGFVVLLAFLIIRRVAPNSPALALGTAAFVAFVPQHMAMIAGAQNDSLAELLLAIILWQITDFKHRISSGKCVLVGVLLGLGLLTKGTIYIALPLVAVVILLRLAVHRHLLSQPGDWVSAYMRWTWLAKTGSLIFSPALVVALPWWVRNVIVYGWPDFLVSIRHDVVVSGQLTPAGWIAQFGLAEYLRQYLVTTFHSFWGQFGWMGVPMNGRYYAVLAVLSLVSLAGLIWFLYFTFQTSTLRLRFEIWHLTFGLWILFTMATYVWYNTKYVQFQGRYLFPALIPIGLAFTIGLRQWATLLPRAWRDAALTIPFAGLAALDVIALFRMIVPMLAP